MADHYEQMTDDELRRVVAEREGWTEIKLNLNRSALVGKAKDSSRFSYLPNWPQSTDDALALLQQTGYGLAYYDEESGWFVNEGGYLWENTVASHQNPARAITIAWLRWQDAQESPENAP